MGKELLSWRPSFFKIMIGDFQQRLRIPPSFIKHLNGNFPGNSILRSPTGRSWHARVEKISHYLFLQKGWEAFARDHRLETGDFLLFLYDGDLGFDVRIYGKSGFEKEVSFQEPSDHAFITGLKVCQCKTPNKGSKGKANCGNIQQKHRTLADLVRKRALESESYLKAKHAHFITTICGCRLKKIMVPKALVKKYGIKNKKHIILRDPLGISWTVKFNKWSDGRVQLRTGWVEFLEGNCLEVGDACLFEFIEGGDVMLVHIFRVKEEATALTRNPTEETGESTQWIMKPLPMKKRKMVNRAAISFQSKNPHFINEWRLSQLYGMPVPMLFMKGNDLLHKDQVIILRDFCGRSWRVKVSKWDDGRVVLATGWAQFSRANRLEEGDACVFEFVQEGNVVDTHIFRAEETVGTGDLSSGKKVIV